MLKEYCKNPILSGEVINSLKIVSDGVYVDCTFGQGGHSRMILSSLNKHGRLLAIDRDYSAVQVGEKLEKKDKRFTVIYGKFSKLFKYIKHHNLIGQINGILFDLGLSRMQLENSKRGFSFIRNGPLDMRMDTNCGISAASWLHTASLEKIVWVLKTFGEERFARRIANAIIMYRTNNPLIYTHELVRLIICSMPFRDQYKHPATRTFQAIRIYINNELEEIKEALKAALCILAPGGRLLVISFHSLEDRIVKNFIRQHSLPSSISNAPLCGDIVGINNKYHYDSGNCFRSYNQNQVYLKFINRIFPSEREIKDNVCSRSAVLRCAEKLVI